MKTKSTLAILAAIAFLIGCATQHRGPAYGHEQEFRQQVGNSVPVKDWGYKIQDIRLSEDYQKALVVFDVPVPGQTNMLDEVVFEHDGFRRYKGNVLELHTPPGAPPGTPPTMRQRFVTVSLFDH